MEKKRWSLILIAMCLALAFSVSPVEAQENSSPFSRSSPEDVAMSSERLRHVVNTVQEWVDNGEIAGAVMLVIRHDKVVLHEAVGWNDREKNIPMEVGAIVQMRSMTKPLTGTAVLMLMEEGRFLLDDILSQYLPSFDNPQSKDITIYQLLTHTSGLPGNDLISRIARDRGPNFPQSASLRESADQIGRWGPYIEPGTDFHYSDRSSSLTSAVG